MTDTASYIARMTAAFNAPKIREERIWGPPGTGKTTTLSRLILDAVKHYGSDNVLVASFTKAAAVELVGRNLPVDAEQVGTLHAICYRALGMPTIAETRMAEWNEAHPTLTMTASASGNDDPSWDASSRTDTDRMMASYQTQRSRMIDAEAMKYESGAAFGQSDFDDFVARWEDFKNQNGYLDFCMDEKTEVLTQRGWLNGFDISEGDNVRSIDPLSGATSWQSVESVYRRVGDAAMMAMSNQVVDALVTPSHRWLVSHSGSLTWKTTDQLSWLDRIPRAAPPCDRPTESPYPDAFVELVAWWFTEGSTTATRREGQIGQSHRVNPCHTERIRQCLYTLYGDHGNRRMGRPRKYGGHCASNRPQWNVYVSDKRGMTLFLLSGQVVAELDSVGEDKVPSVDFLSALTLDQLNLFIDTALDADGHRGSGATTFEQKDARRTEAMAFACILAGQAITYHERRGGKNHGQTSITLNSNPLSCVPQRRLISYHGLIWCPTVAKHHNFLARRNGRVYYTGNTDMLAVAHRDFDTAPGDPSIMFLDEAQDLAPLELALARKWARSMDKIVICGDDDQALYSFKGADPQSIFGEKPHSETVLAQSYRVPRAVHALANVWIKKLSWRVEKEYRPRDADGFVEKMWNADYGDPGRAVRRAKELVAEGKTVMFLASCSYMLRSTCAALKDAGVPFHNPMKVRRGDWNPLAIGSAGRKTAVDRVVAYLAIRPDARALASDARVWDADEFRLWATQINGKDLFRHGAKKLIASKDFALPPDDAGRIAAIGNLLRPEAAELSDREHFGNALEGNLDWLYARLAGEQGQRMRYPVKIAKELGPRSLLEKPKVIVGTGHSVKGGECDVAFIIPDISYAGYEEWRHSGPRQDSVRRLFYVMATRAREGVYLLGNSTQQYCPMWAAL